MPDYIELRNIRVWGNHGASAEERQSSQPLDVNVMVEADLSQAQTSDNLDHTVDFNFIYGSVVKVVSTTSFHLLERLAGEILATIFTDKRVRSAQITIAKPGLFDGASPVVNLERENPK